MRKTRKSIEELRALLHYDPATGLFTNRTTRCGRAVAGAVSGSDNGKGYICIRIEGVNYRAHQLAWLFTNGEWPSEWLDHINRDRKDNRICNLRLATPALNAQNRTLHMNNTSGMTGVQASGSKWAAYIGHSGTKHYLGTFNTLADAVDARKKAAAAHHCV